MKTQLKKRVQKTEAQGAFWKPAKIGDKIEGTFSHFEAGMADNPNPVLVFTSGKKLGLSYDLRDKISSVWSRLKAGKSKLSVTFTGTVPVKKRKTEMKLFAVRLDGKELVSSSGFVHLKPSELKDYFSRVHPK